MPVSNAGVLTASIPAGTTFASATGGGTSSGNTVTWNVGTVAAGGTARYSYTVTVGAGVVDGTLLQAKSQFLDGSTSLVRATTSTEVKAISPLTLTATATPDPVPASSALSYTYTVKNVSANALTNLTLSSITRSGATAIVSQISGGGGCPTVNSSSCAPGVTVSWPSFSLAAGATLTFTMGAQSSAGQANGALIHNQATVNYTGGSVTQGRDVAVHQ